MYKKRKTIKRRKTTKGRKTNRRRKINKRRHIQKGGELLVDFPMKGYLERAHYFYNNNSRITTHCVFQCDNDWCGNRQGCKRFKRIPLKVSGSNVLKSCPENTETNDYGFSDEYFKDYHANLDYLKSKYSTYFSLPPSGWNELIDKIIELTPVEEGKEKVILGPGELLIPFVNEGFLYLAHEHWTPNINYNYIIQILYKLREFWMIIPSENTVMDNFFSLISGCTLHGSENAFKRVTLSELLLLNELQERNLINIEEIKVELSDGSIIQNDENGYKIPFNYYKLYSKQKSHITKNYDDKPCEEDNTLMCYNPTTTNNCLQTELYKGPLDRDNKIPPTWGCDVHPSFKFHMLYITPTENFNSIIPNDYIEALRNWTQKKQK